MYNKPYYQDEKVFIQYFPCFHLNSGKKAKIFFIHSPFRVYCSDKECFCLCEPRDRIATLISREEFSSSREKVCFFQLWCDLANVSCVSPKENSKGYSLWEEMKPVFDWRGYIEEVKPFVEKNTPILTIYAVDIFS